MIKPKRNTDIESRLADMTIPSDNTRVASPYRVKSRIEAQQNRPRADLQEVLKKAREEDRKYWEKIREAQRKKEEEERLEKERRDRVKALEDFYKKRQAEKQRQYEEQKKQIEAQAKIEKEKKDKLYEPEYKSWLDDVTKHPDNYASTTVNVVKKAMHSYKHPNDYLARVDRGIARALFNIKNYFGSVALSSIDTNGQRITGQIGLAQHKIDVLPYHQRAIELKQTILDLQQQQTNLDPRSPEYAQISSSINNINAQLNDPLLKKFDEDYQQLYTIDKEGVWDTVKRAYKTAVSAMTYDQYKGIIAERDRQRDVNNYYNALTEEQYRQNRGYKGADFLYTKVPAGAGYRSPEARRRDLSTYSQAELLALDAQKTNQRAEELDGELKAYQQELIESRNHLKDSQDYWNVSEYFKAGIRGHQNDRWNSLGYWGYSTAELLGSTFSSPEQVQSTALQAASMAGYASSPYTAGLGGIIGMGAGVVAGVAGVESGYHENQTEAGDKRIDNFKEILSQPNVNKWDGVIKELKDRSRIYWRTKGWSEEQINQYLEGEKGERRAVNDYFAHLTDEIPETQFYNKPITDPDVQDALLYSTQGLQALYEADNMRTIAGNIFQTAVTVLPTRAIWNGAKAWVDRNVGAKLVEREIAADAAGRVTAVAESTAARQTAKNAASGTYSNGFRKLSFTESTIKSAAKGAAIGEALGLGFVGSGITGTTAAVVSGLRKLGVSMLSPKARGVYRAFEEAVIHKYQGVYDKLLPKSKFGKAAAIYGGRLIRNTLASGFSEAAEETVQYLNSKEDYASKYGWNGMPISDIIINDLYQGSRVTNTYLAVLGLSNSELMSDPEYWANYQGGFALSMLHTGSIRLGIEGFNAYKEIPTHQAIITSAVMNRELDAKDRASNVEFARQAMRKRSAESLSVLEWMERNDSRREDPFYSQEDYDEKRKAINRITQLVSDKDTKARLEARGLVYGTEEYANAIADLYSVEQQNNQNTIEARKEENDIQKYWNSPEYQKEADEIVEGLLAGSFEETLGNQAAVIEAGNKAVADEIANKKKSIENKKTQVEREVQRELERAVAAGENTTTKAFQDHLNRYRQELTEDLESVEDPEFQKHLQDVRKEAQEVASKNSKIDYRNKIINLSHAAHKLQSLIKLRAQHNTISDFFKFISDKFNLNPKRPDAKYIVQSIDNQISQLKDRLAEIDPNFNTNLSDKAILDYIETLPIIRSNSEEIEQHEIAAAMIEADRAVINKHAQAIEYGLVKNKSGKWVYNPKAYKAKQEKTKRLGQQLNSGEIDFDEFISQMREQEDAREADQKELENDPYKKRIQAIIETRKENSALNWMINDIENGDGVTKILDKLAEEEEKTANSEEAIEKAKAESETLDIEQGEETPIVESTVEQEVVATQPETPKQKYKRIAKNVKKKYEERKKSLRDLRRNLRNRLNALPIPIPTPLLDIANYLISKVQLGTYKIAQFAEELKNIAENRGIQANQFLSGIKSFYIDKTMEMISLNPELMENVSSIEEVMSFNFGTDITYTQPAVFGTAQEMQDQINEDTAKINRTLSSNYDTIVNEGNTVVVYPNRESITNARFGEQHFIWKWVVDKLTAANTSDSEFKKALEEIFANHKNVPIDEYTKYRNVEYMIQAIANVRSNNENEESVQNGKRIRNAVVSILLGREDQIDTTYFVGDYEEFRRQILHVKEQLTSTTNGKGLTILDTFTTIYGLDMNGQRISSEADIIATNGEKIYAIDVRYSFQTIRVNWNTKYKRATFPIGEHVTRRLKQIESIINNKFNKGVNGLYCLPVIYNPSDKILTVDIENNKYLIQVRPETQDSHDESVGELRESAENIVSEINSNVEEYNRIAEEARKYSDLYDSITPAELQEFETVQDYTDYINQLHAKYDSVIDRIDEMKQLINRNENLYSEYWRTEVLPNAQQDMEVNSKALLDRLHTVCQELDSMLDMIPDLKLTTQEEKDNVQHLIDLIFEAQLCLNDVLTNSSTDIIDVLAEEELISTALEKMTQNKDTFGGSSVFVRNWWATQFAVGPRHNTSESVLSVNDQYFGYINRIDSWITTLRQHVLTELENNIPLQEWYSAVLNNYFSKLLDNAERFSNESITDAAQRIGIQTAVKAGRGLIEEFNGVWDTRPEDGFDGPVTSPVDLINRMPVKWKDLYGETTSVMPSFDQMSNRDGKHTHYYWLSLSPTFLDSKFILSLDRNGNVQLYIEGTTLNGTKGNTTLTFENDLSKASPQDAERWQYVNNARQRFLRKAKAAIKFVQEHPEYEIRFDKFTDKGQIAYDENGQLQSVTNWLFANSANKHDLYTIKLSKDDRIGIMVRINNNETGIHTYNVKGGDNMLDDIGGFDREFQKQKVHTQSGAIVYYYDTGNGQYIGTPIQSTAIGEQDAAKLVYLMEKYLNGDRTDQYGFDIYELLSLRLYMANPNRQITKYNNTGNMISLENNRVVIGNQSYNIVSQKAELIRRIAQMGNVTRGLTMNQYLRTSNNSVISRVRSLFGSSSQQKMQLTNGLVFDKEDFTHQNTGAGTQDGSTWLGYMLRNGLLGSSAKRLNYKELRIDNLRVVKKGSEEEKTLEQEVKQAQKKQAPKITVKDDFWDRLSKLQMTVNESEIDMNRGSEEQEAFVNNAIAYFNKVLGTSAGALSFSDKKFLKAVSKNGRVIGICTSEGIKLSKYAPESVAWHEAFHRIFELVIDAKERDRFYDAYRNRFVNRIFRKVTDRDVAEAFADMFVTYMENKEALNKADSFIKKLLPWAKTFAFNLGMMFKLGKNTSKEIYELYNRINQGEYKDSIITEEQNKRFEDLFGEGLYYTVTNTDNKHSANFSHLADIGDRDKLVRGLSYFILKAFGIDQYNPKVARVRITAGTEDYVSTLDKLAEIDNGSVVEYLKNAHPVFQEVFEKQEKEFKTKDGKVIKRNYYPKFDALSRHIADYIDSLFDTMRKPKVEEDDSDNTSETQNDTGEAVDFMSKDTDHWDKAAYEFSRLDSLMDEVKLFFGTIPYSKYEDVTLQDGTVERQVVVDWGRNKFGCPEFMPIEETWNLVANECMEASSIEELDKMLENLAGRKEVYAQIYAKFHKLIQGIYKYNEDGKVIVAQTNFDKESFAIQILEAIQNQKLKFLVALSSKQKDGDREGKAVSIKESSMDRDSKSYADQWNRYLVSGQIGVFQRERGESQAVDSQGKKKKTLLIFRDGMGGKNGEDVFSRTAKFFDDLRTALLNTADEITIDGAKYNKVVLDDANRIKDEIVHRLNVIGIMFERDALDYMLSELYRGVDIDAVTRFLNDSPVSTDQQVIEDAKKSTLTSFINKLNTYVSNNGFINQKAIEEEGYAKIGFVNKLATWQGKYKRISSQNMAYALNGKKLFSISQNSTISHIIKALNTQNLDNETINVLSHFDYNVMKNDMGLPIGSIILKAIQNRQAFNINGYTYIGFKTDNKGDQGSEYTEEATAEDYIAKLTMLQEGYLIFPTLSDKGTWMIMDGVHIPGMTFINTEDDSGNEQTIVNNAPTVKVFGGKAYLVPNDAVLDQMIEYAKCELMGIQQCMDDLGLEAYPEIDGYARERRQTPISNDQKIQNYHTAGSYKDSNGNKHSVEPNGTRFLSLTKLVVNEYNKKTGKFELNTYNLNDPRESSANLLKLANEKFFAKREGETDEQMLARQRETMALTLAIQTQNGIDAAVNLGIVQRIGYQFKSENKVKQHSESDRSLMNLDSKDLNAKQIDALQRYIMRTTSYRNSELKWKDIKDANERAFYSKMARSLAIAAIIQDATNRHIICSQEVQRCFAGHPALFKVKYSSTGIQDSAYDIQKRIGGLVSTGDDNILSLPGIKREYTCAECKDYEVSTRSNIASRLEDMFATSHVKFIVRQKTGDAGVYKMTVDEIREKYPHLEKTIDDAFAEGTKYAKAFKNGDINVADGAAYITADMCRDMLRMRGAYNNKVRKAFKILMSGSKYDWVKSAEAYKTVYEALNVVPTKYTAYGFRSHTSNGSQVSNIAVAYYNKFALFPIFPGMASGKMEGVYQKMLDEEVDMLLMQSAVKVGSQGAVEFDGETISKPFNKYTQSYAYLRRQLNTDPKEKDKNPIGTQMMKIGLANLDRERTYLDLDGKEVSGQQVLDDLMGAVNALARIGASELEDMFTDIEEERDVNGELISQNKVINYEKVSDYLKEELTQRNANKTLIQAIQTVVDPVTGKKKLACPLAATTDAAWIESIFISMMNKKIVDITTPGKSFIQRSVFAMEGESTLAPTINGGKKLQMINEEGSMDTVVSIDYFRDILPKDLSFEEAHQWLIDQGIISGVRTGETEWSNAEATIIGYRIPTQAQSSIHALRVVDVIQAAKDTIILPEEFTKITGSDFDIDHLYLASFNFRMDDAGHLTRHYDLGTKEYYQNKILESLMILLKDTENSLNSLYKPIDNDTELITDVSDFIPETGSTKGDPYNFGTLHEQVIRKNDYITGKKGIAPFALNSTGHMLGKVYQPRFNQTKLVQATRLSDFDTTLDKDDNVVASWLSGFINAHVDIVKDPYISRLNVNQFTYNMLNLMVRCGWGDTALWFMANPIIRAMSAANDLADSQYMRRPSSSKSGKTYREELIYNALKEHLDESDISDERLNYILTNKKALEGRIYIVNWLENNQDKLKEAAISGKMDHETAVNVFYAWKILEKYSFALSALVQHTKVDTRKYGKNFISVQKYFQEYKEIFYPDDPTESIWDVRSLQHMAEHSWIDTKTKLVAEFPSKIFGGLTFNANERFVNGVLKFAKKLEYDGRTLYQDDVVELSRHLQTAIKSKYFTKYAREVLNMSDKDIADLFIGYKSMNRQLVSLKDLIANNPAYARLASNPFLNQIYSMLEDRPVFANGREMSDRPGFVTVLDNVDDSKLNSDLLSEGWLDLMNDEDVRVRKFAKKFVVYAFFSSGEFKGWNKMLKYVPFEWISGEVDSQFQSYSDFVEDELQHVSDDYSDLLDDVVANNFMDYRFAKQTELVNEDGTRNFLNNDRGVRIGKGVNADQIEDIAEYVSIKKPGMYFGHQDSYELYKLMSVVAVGKNHYPVYAKLKKRGYHTRGNDVYEYNWDFNYAENENKGSDTFNYEAALQRVQEFIKAGALDGFTDANIRAINKVYRTAESSVEQQPTAPKQQVEDGAHIATRGYKKGDPQKHPNFNYVFTENAQALIASRFADKDYNLGIEDPNTVKLNVSDVNGTNQAGIRTDEQGNLTRNAYGVVVKKYQQDATGKFVAQEGTFKDTDEDFNIFKALNTDVFNILQQSQNKVIVFPQQMALGKAALPKRFAEWLQSELANRFDIVAEVKKNEHSNYEGYGLELKDVGVEYDWKYEEDSGYSGVLEELPPKVRMNGKYVYRPQYEFGRIYLTDDERKFVDEKITATIDDLEYLPENVNTISQLHNDGVFNIDNFGEEPKNDSNKTPIPNEYKNLIDELFDMGFISEHDFDESGEKISKRAIKFVSFLTEDNLVSVMSTLAVIRNQLDIMHSELFNTQFEDLIYDYMVSMQEDGLFNEIDNVSYLYSNKRQQELFSDEDFELSEEEQREVEEYKKMCEGGKI